MVRTFSEGISNVAVQQSCILCLLSVVNDG